MSISPRDGRDDGTLLTGAVATLFTVAGCGGSGGDDRSVPNGTGDPVSASIRPVGDLAGDGEVLVDETVRIDPDDPVTYGQSTVTTGDGHDVTVDVAGGPAATREWEGGDPSNACEVVARIGDGSVNFGLYCA